MRRADTTINKNQSDFFVTLLSSGLAALAVPLEGMGSACLSYRTCAASLMSSRLMPNLRSALNKTQAGNIAVTSIAPRTVASCNSANHLWHQATERPSSNTVSVNYCRPRKEENKFRCGWGGGKRAERGQRSASNRLF